MFARWITLSLLAVSACSFTVRGPDPMQTVSESPVCDRSADGRRALDLVPAAVGIAGMGMAGFAIVINEIEDQSGDSRGRLNVPKTLIIIPPLIAGVAIWAIVHNVRMTRACRRAWTKHEDWRRQHDPAYPKTDEERCTWLIANWRAEPDMIRKTQRWDEIPADCQRPITR